MRELTLKILDDGTVEVTIDGRKAFAKTRIESRPVYLDQNDDSVVADDIHIRVTGRCFRIGGEKKLEEAQAKARASMGGILEHMERAPRKNNTH